MSRPFFDTNTLLYLISEDSAKADKVERLLLSRGVISVQVLNEFTNIAQRKHILPLQRIRPFLQALRDACEVVPLTLEIHDTGLDLVDRYRFSIYDAMIISAALHHGCDTVLSEDMQSGMSVLGKLEIRNPFLG
jgi:predicted nucleic acid-binding protein